jgi:hypothetical protein
MFAVTSRLQLFAVDSIARLIAWKLRCNNSIPGCF